MAHLRKSGFRDITGQRAGRSAPPVAVAPTLFYFLSSSTYEQSYFAPREGWYAIGLTGGGGGGSATQQPSGQGSTTTSGAAQGGMGGYHVIAFHYLLQGQEVRFLVGAGGEAGGFTSGVNVQGASNGKDGADTVAMVFGPGGLGVDASYVAKGGQGGLGSYSTSAVNSSRAERSPLSPTSRGCVGNLMMAPGFCGLVSINQAQPSGPGEGSAGGLGGQDGNTTNSTYQKWGAGPGSGAAGSLILPGGIGGGYESGKSRHGTAPGGGGAGRSGAGTGISGYDGGDGRAVITYCGGMKP